MMSHNRNTEEYSSRRSESYEIGVSNQEEQEELSSLTDQCRELLSAKQDLIDKARTILVGNRNLVQRMQASTGIPVTSDSDDPAFTNFNQIIDEWTVQVRSRIGEEMQESEPEDINKLLFSAIVQSN